MASAWLLAQVCQLKVRCQVMATMARVSRIQQQAFNGIVAFDLGAGADTAPSTCRSATRKVLAAHAVCSDICKRFVWL